MKIFVSMDDSNVVTNAAVFDDDNTPQHLGWPGWVETDATIHNKQAAPGDTYVPDATGHPNGLFYSPSPHTGWVLDSNYDWQPPADKPYPEGWPGPPATWFWDEETGDWEELEPSAADAS